MLLMHFRGALCYSVLWLQTKRKGNKRKNIVFMHTIGKNDINWNLSQLFLCLFFHKKKKKNPSLWNFILQTFSHWIYTNTQHTHTRTHTQHATNASSTWHRFECAAMRRAYRRRYAAAILNAKPTWAITRSIPAEEQPNREHHNR